MRPVVPKTESLKRETASKIQELARINVDSSQGLLKAAEVVEDPTLASLFRSCSAERARFARTLMGTLGSDQPPAPGIGTLKAKVHQWWMELRTLLSRGDHAILAEAERGEDQIKAAYEEIILETTGSPVNDVLHAQLRQVKADHDRIRDLRDAKQS